MSEQPPDSLIPYDEIVQEALRAVVGRVLGEVEATGRLPGEHHFYITFKTAAAGVDVPRHLSERFPDEMTIVIQNRFWDLKVRKDGFEVLREIKTDDGLAHIPVVMLTVKTHNADIVEGLKEGAELYLPKPFHPKELVSLVKRVLESEEAEAI